jgi:hypothetical protein
MFERSNSGQQVVAHNWLHVHPDLQAQLFSLPEIVPVAQDFAHNPTKLELVFCRADDTRIAHDLKRN